MRIQFPDAVDDFRLRVSRETRNEAQTDEKVGMMDILYILYELEKYVLTMTGAVTTTEETTEEYATSAQLTSLTSQITTLQAQMALLPAYLTGAGAPSSSLGKNGDSYWDTTNLQEYRKLGGTWRQVT